MRWIAVPNLNRRTRGDPWTWRFYPFAGPCPCVASDGVANQPRHRVWVVEDDRPEPMRELVVPPYGVGHGAPIGEKVRLPFSEPCPAVVTSGVSTGKMPSIAEDDRPEAPPPADRPPYVVPTLDEIREVPWNGLGVVSTFAGGGGSSTGYRMAGYRVAAAVERDAKACETYRANHPDARLLERDVRELTADQLLEAAGVGRGELDVLDGSPPCETFSAIGRRDKAWGEGRGEDLFFEYARLLDGMRPRAFVAENVMGLARGKAIGQFRRVVDALREPGYRVAVRRLDAQWLGVPQTRQRAIFVGVREDLDRDPAFPEPLPYRYVLADAIPYARRHGHGGSDFQTWHREGRDQRKYLTESDREPSGAICTWPPAEENGGVGHFAIGAIEVEDDDERAAVEMTHSRPTMPRKHRRGANEPARTITGENGRQNPRVRSRRGEVRRMTIDEVKAVCSFPPDYRLVGNFAQQWERCGDSVPPVMMSHIARAVAEKVLCGF